MTISRDIFHEPQCPICYEDYNNITGTDCIVFSCDHFFCAKCALEILNRAQDNRVSCPICRKVIVLTFSEQSFEGRYWKTALTTVMCSTIGMYTCISILSYRRTEINENGEEEINYISGRNYIIIGFGILLGTFGFAIKYLQNGHREMQSQKRSLDSYVFSKETIQTIKYYPPLKSDIIDV